MWEMIGRKQLEMEPLGIILGQGKHPIIIPYLLQREHGFWSQRERNSNLDPIFTTCVSGEVTGSPFLSLLQLL